MKSNIYTDLGIEVDVQSIMADPAAFDKAVKEKADELLSAMKSSSRFSEWVELTKKEAATHQASIDRAQEITETVRNDLYEQSDAAPLTVQILVIEHVRQLLKDLETSFESNCREAMLQEANTIEDKKLAHWQYSELRNAFEKFRTFAEQFDLGTFVPLAPKSGNFGESNSVIFNIRGERFSNPIVVCKMLEIEFESIAALKDYIANLDDEEIFTESL